MDSAKIMIVEDKTMVAEDCRDCLENLGYTVSSVVASGEESIEKAASDRPDAVLMDIHLRDEMDGIDAADLIYSRFDIPVVFLSAYSDSELLKRAKQVGSFGYLVKPFEQRELYVTLEMALYKSNAEKERKRLEARLRQAQKMKAISTLAGGIAHRFNNYLSVITGGIDILETHFADDEALTDFTKDMKDSAVKMTELAAKLLAFARAGKYHPQIISLNDFVRETLPLIQPIFSSTIQVDTDLSDDIINVKADLTQMQMALSDVLTNALEAIEKKGRIRIACSRKIISEQTARHMPGFKPGGYACLTVTDNGRGMDEETKNQVFEPFYTTKFTGRGLGMAATYGFVKNHDGYITVDSNLGHGTKVTIFLPVI